MHYGWLIDMFIIVVLATNVTSQYLYLTIGSSKGCYKFGLLIIITASRLRFCCMLDMWQNFISVYGLKISAVSV
ncbi:hypothetical protein ERO13_A11G090033v2 [Gossypium hirsutum]|uniref:Uncharacterized protein n=2 Tax=Gossypium TaxID=3633 RepID=A0A5D2X7S5_GOSMU|nr:hypothetical protein ERO13_A11G090033v2 [Gossypium hirsutum]TYG93355.1 hypothetical protein ES288_A11G103200v1 [Gossypium darwinii]TYJ08841.1 hypothetical protein E1A91_A11G099800v1 [Gossypium mustelinum]